MAMPRGPMAMPRGSMAMPRDVMHVCVERCEMCCSSWKSQVLRISGCRRIFWLCRFPGDHGNIKITVTDHMRESGIHLSVI